MMTVCFLVEFPLPKKHQFASKRVSDEQIKQVQELWKKRFGNEISRDEAYSRGTKLMRLIELVYGPMSEDECKKVEERRKETHHGDAQL